MSARGKGKKGGGGGSAFWKLAAALLCVIQVRHASAKGVRTLQAPAHAADGVPAGLPVHVCAQPCLVRTPSRCPSCFVPAAPDDGAAFASCTRHLLTLSLSPPQRSMRQCGPVAPTHARPSLWAAAHERWVDPSTCPAGAAPKPKSIGARVRVRVRLCVSALCHA